MVRLRELGLVDDAAWASRYAAERFVRTGKGRHRIRAELLARGIDREAAEAALASLPAGAEERDKAAAVLAALRQKMGTVPISRSGTATGADSRLFRRMIARGWPASLVRELLAEPPG
jgi:regulatory protein